MNRKNKIALLAACGLSALTLASCNNTSPTGGSYKHAYNYIVVSSENDIKPSVLFEINGYTFPGLSEYISVEFETKLDKKHFMVKDNWFLFEEKPSKHYMILSMVQKSGLMPMKQLILLHQ